MTRLVALDLPPGPQWVLELCRVWDTGDAVLPVDPRLPAPARLQLFQQLDPDEIVRSDGYRDPVRTHPSSLPPLRDGDALVVPTSGTTGAPRGAIHTHAGLAAHARAVHAFLGVDRGSDRWLACLPLTHVGGLGVVTRALIDEVPIEVHAGFDAERVAAAARDGATLTSLVTTALDRVDPELFRWILLGGSADPKPRPQNVVHTYGLTETGGGIVYEGVALGGVEVRIDAGGLVSVRGPQLMRAYRDGTVPFDSEGWFQTGDLGHLDDEGRLEIEGRADDLIVTGGENVWPAAVEAALAGTAGVAEVAVVGHQDPEWGQRVVAFVVPQPGEPLPTLATIRARVKDRLPSYAAPKEMILVERLERTALGKVRRSRLRAAGEAGPSLAPGNR